MSTVIELEPVYKSHNEKSSLTEAPSEPAVVAPVVNLRLDNHICVVITTFITSFFAFLVYLSSFIFNGWSHDEVAHEFFSKFYICSGVLVAFQLAFMAITARIAGGLSVIIFFMVIYLAKITILMFIMVEMLIKNESLLDHPTILVITIVAILDFLVLSIAHGCSKS